MIIARLTDNLYAVYRSWEQEVTEKRLWTRVREKNKCFFIPGLQYVLIDDLHFLYKNKKSQITKCRHSSCFNAWIFSNRSACLSFSIFALPPHPPSYSVDFLLSWVVICVEKVASSRGCSCGYNLYIFREEITLIVLDKGEKLSSSTRSIFHFSIPRPPPSDFSLHRIFFPKLFFLVTKKQGSRR